MHAATFRITPISVTLLAAFVCGAGLARAQGTRVSGTVRSDAGELVPGVTVTVPGLAVHVSTAANGRYAFTVAAASARGQTMLVRFRRGGFRERAETLAARPGEQVLDVTLLRDPNALDAQIGAGVLDSTRRIATSIAVARVDTPAVPVPATDPLTQLAGRVPGLSIFSASGRPGRQPDVLVRGPTSIDASGRGQNPLYIVDGVIISGGLPSLDPQDIENVEVVRGAAAGSLYGLRGAGGVVSISTRSSKASADGFAFRFRSEVGASDIEREIELARQHALLTDETGRRFCISDPTQPLCARSLDWLAETRRVNEAPGDYALAPQPLAFDPGSGTSGPALQQTFLARNWPVPTYNAVRQVLVSRPYINTNVDVQSGGTGARYFASLSHLRQAGAIRYLDGFTRYTARLNVDQRIADKVWIALRSSLGRGTSDGSNQEGQGNLFFRLTRQPASADLLQRDTLGRLYARSNIMSQGDQNANPLLYTAGNGVTDRTIDGRFIGGGTLRWSPASWADVEAAFSYDRSTSRYEQYIPKGFRTQGQARTSYRGFLEYDNYGHEAYNGSLSLTVRHSPARNLSVRWLVRSLFERLDSYAYRMSGDSLAVRGIEDAANITANRILASEDASERLVGLLAGVSLAFRETLFGDLVLRRDGSSLVGSADRWANFGRASFAYRLSQERWWPLRDALDEFTLRAAYGTAGGRPRFSAQYETYNIYTGGALYPGQLANPNLRPETSAELTLGADVELFRRVGITITYARSDTRDQIMPVWPPSGTGFSWQWQNAGALKNKTWELSVNVPLIRTRSLSWSTRFNYDRTRTMITRLDIPEYFTGPPTQGAGSMLKVAANERYGTIYGFYVLHGYGDCAKLPTNWQGTNFQAQCGPGLAFQENSDGNLVWVGQGNSPTEGLTKNLWMAKLPAAQAPWGAPLSWGMLIALRDSNGSRMYVPLGNALPDYRFSVSSTLQFRRLSVYALLEGVIGRDVWNEGRHWSYVDFINRDVDQRGLDPGLAKPIGYYYRIGPPDHGTGIGGMYQSLAPYNLLIEDASFAKLRELSVTYNVGRLGGVGNWSVSLIGRNVFTITKYRGFDPEVGFGGGTTQSSTINAVDAYVFPNLRTFTFALSTSF